MRNLEETFRYDDQNRLTDVQLGAVFTGASAYDSYGRMTAKTADGQAVFSGAVYNAAGKPLTDPSRRIDIIYNRLNKPERVLTSQSDWMRYSYSSSGVLLRKELHSLAVPGGRVTDYCGEFLYEDNELVCIFTPFGRITSMETANGTQWRTSYSLADHLGNVRVEFAAHGNGQPELLQQTDYYPFGYILRRNDYGGVRPNLRLYGGKELQDETLAGCHLGWYDFEARMYDPLIGRFLTTDPLAEKYYGLTPYGYCGNNPMNAYDLHGDSISIVYNNNESVLYFDGNLYNGDGTAFEGKNYFLTQCMNAIGEIKNSSVGNEMISALQLSSNMFTISEGDNDYKPLRKDRVKAFANQIKTDPEMRYLLEITTELEGGAGGKIVWNPYGTELPTTEGIRANGHMDLAHELSHAFDSDRGLLDDRKEQGVSRTEWQAVQRENLIRAQLGHPLRTHYNIAVDPRGKCVGGIAPRLLTNDNKPLPLPW